jgi:hypothetical protein
MPRKAKLRRRPIAWNAEHRRILESGCDYFQTFESDEQRQAAWNELRETILSDWLQRHPDARPWAWWRYDLPAGERRERTDGGRHPFDDPEFDLPRELHYGKPRFRRSQDMEAQFETRREFLERLQLLQPSERRLLEGSKD